MLRSTSAYLFLIVFILATLTLTFPSYTQAQAPQISNVTPTSGVAGTQVTITGSGFGAAQGSGNVWLGSTYGVVVNWSDTQVVATIASGAKSGTAQILQGGVWSNPVNLTVATPNVTSVTPNSGVAGTQVTITGTGFGATKGSGNVWLGSTYGVVGTWSDTQVVATIASGAKSGTAQILQGGVWSNPVNLTVATPNITSVTPISGVAGTQVTIVGTGFGATQGSGSVWLGSTYGVVGTWSDTQVVATIASGAKSGTAQILQGGVWSNSINLTVATPNITTVTPTSGVAGTQVTITGTGFGATQGSGNVWLGSTYGVVGTWSDTQVVATIASGAKSGTAQILQGGVWSNSINLTVATPNITTVTPTSGVAGTQVTITGTGFGATQGSGNVWLGSTYGVVGTWSDTQVVATIASGAKSGSAQILQGGVWSNAVNLTVVTPTITTVTPTSGVAGTQVTITGSGFGATQGSGNVWLGSTYGVVGTWSDTQVVATIASGAKSGSAQILQGGVWSNSINLTVATPNITTVTPTSGVAGTQVTITGTGFGATQGSGNVWLGSTYGVVGTWSDTQVVATIASGAKSGTAQILQGGVWSNSVNLTVVTPNITTVTPTSGVAGTQVTITGSGFGATQGSGNVWLGSTYGVVETWSDTQVVATIASGAKSGTAQILQGGVWSDPVNFTVNAAGSPSITSLAPSSGPIGTPVTITGTGFGSTQGTSTVTFNGIIGTTTSWSDTSIVVPVPSGATTGSVQVTVLGQHSNSVNFTVTGAFVPTGAMNTARQSHSATLLNDGTVLIAGGTDATRYLTSTAELYTSSAGTFTSTGSLTTPRDEHTAILLNYGKVLIVGGNDSNGKPLASAELYDPATHVFTSTGSLKIARWSHTYTATLLNNGMVVIAGGEDMRHVQATAELYDPGAGIFTATGSLNIARYYHSATLLNNGKILIVGGIDSNGNTLASAELYDPDAGTFTATGSLNAARVLLTATLLNNGMVLIAGGFDSTGNVEPTSELYDPATGVFTTTGSPGTPRNGCTATLLSDGTVLFVGGSDSNGNTLASAELYDPRSRTYSYTASLSIAEGEETATRLSDGTVLFAGGVANNGLSLNNATLYQPATLTPLGLVSIAVSPLNSSLVRPTAQLFTAAGTFSDGSTETLASATWSSSDNTIATITNDATNQGHAFGVAGGSVTISACTGFVCGSAEMTVSSSQLTSFSVTSTAGIITTSSTTQFLAVATLADGSTADVTSSATWSSSSPQVATINSAGVASGVLPGQTTITASWNGFHATALLTIVVPMSVSPQDFLLRLSGTEQLTATHNLDGGGTQDVTATAMWTSSNPAVATVSAGGLVTGVSEGSATITASLGAAVGSTVVTVTTSAPALTAVLINPSNAYVPLDSTQQFTVMGTLSDGSMEDVTAFAVWSSSNANLVTVNASGLATTVNTGIAKITATVNGLSSSTNVIVTGTGLVCPVSN